MKHALVAVLGARRVRLDRDGSSGQLIPVRTIRWLKSSLFVLVHRLGDQDLDVLSGEHQHVVVGFVTCSERGRFWVTASASRAK